MSIYVPGRIESARVGRRRGSTVETVVDVDESSDPDTSTDNWGYYEDSWLWAQGGLRADFEVTYCMTDLDPACTTTQVEIESASFQSSPRAELPKMNRGGDAATTGYSVETSRGGAAAATGYSVETSRGGAAAAT